jgi:hypothetical protein
MKAEKKINAPGAAAYKPAVVTTLDDTAKPEEVAAEVPDTAPETEEKVKEEKGKKGKKGKSCKGIWVVEMKGPYGWEHIAIAFMKNGEYLGAGPNHYAVGAYKVSGNTLDVSITVTQCGKLRTMFGKKSMEDLQITSKCKFEKNKIVGVSKAKGVKKFDVLIRLTRIGSL